MAHPAGRGGPSSDEHAEFVRAFETARASGDVAAMAAAAHRLGAGRRFGAPTTVAGYLHEAYELAAAQEALRWRALLAVELARAWAYANEPQRSAPYAADAVGVAEQLGDPAVLAAALDADLLTRWGPDDLTERVAAASRLEAVAGRLTDVEARLSAAVWRLTTALETLDVVAVRRQLRVLEALAWESGSARVRMFSASRHGMHALLDGEVAAARHCLDLVRAAAEESEEPDGEALVHVLTSGIARQEGNVAALRAEAAAYQEFGTAQGIRSVLAEACTFWLEAGEPDRAAALVEQVVPHGVDGVPRDVDWLLVVASVVEVAARVGMADLAGEGIERLEPYAGRGVINAGGVAFVGVVDGVLATACAALGRQEDAARHVRAATTGYRRLGARWWAERLGTVVRPATPVAVPTVPEVTATDRILLAPAGDDVWLVGSPERPTILKAAKGFRYLRLLLARPGVPLSAVDLAAAVNGTPPATQSDTGELLDRRALAAYRARLTQLDADLDQARHAGDAGRAEALAAERSFLLDEVAAATGLGGRARRSGGDAERARVAVQKAIAVAVRRIGQAHAPTGRILRDTVRTGTTCSYEPDPDRPVRWLLDQQTHPDAEGRR